MHVAVQNFSSETVLIITIMKTLPSVSLLSIGLLVSMLFTGCSSVSVPPAAKGYSVRAGDVVYFARTVKIHGNWVELETDSGPVIANGVVITPKN